MFSLDTRILAHPDDADDRDRAWVPIPAAELPTPRPQPAGQVDTRAAKRAVFVVCALVNEAAGPVLEALSDGRR